MSRTEAIARPPWAWPRAAYVHVPFCAHKCGYCDFASLAGADALVSAMPDSPLGPPIISLSTVLTAVAVLVGAGALAGIMPASHAASIKPIEALRAE